MEFCTRVRLKPSNDRSELELYRTKSNNNIAENSFALGHETHNIPPPNFKCLEDLEKNNKKIQNARKHLFFLNTFSHRSRSNKYSI